MAAQIPIYPGDLVVPARVTFSFRSSSGSEYIYDDSTGAIFSWSPLRDEILEGFLAQSLGELRPLLEARYGAAETGSEVEFVGRMMSRYGAFTRKAPSMAEKTVTPEELQGVVRGISRQLILVVTEDCNLRCSYCAYSGANPFTRTYSARHMSADIAIASIDQFVEFSHPHKLSLGKRGSFGLSFYGGEPLINSKTIRVAAEHVKKNYPELFTMVLTSNGTLLNADNASILADSGISVAVSIDGPKTVHDRARHFSSGNGTFDLVIRNLERFRKDHPAYYKDNVRAICTFDWKTDLIGAAQFFRESKDLFPLGVMANPVSRLDDDYYSHFSEDEKRAHYNGMERLRAEYLDDLVNERELDPFSYGLFGGKLLTLHQRTRMNDGSSPLLPFSGSCVPGAKVAVKTTGEIVACERVNGTFPLGNVLRTGFDPVAAADMLNRFKRALHHCHKCSLTRLCELCFANLERNHDFRDPGFQCEGSTPMFAKQNLIDYVSVLERNPNCTFAPTLRKDS